eukprot:364585-Chlamydomonas_euryale.AAC.19
MDRGVGEGRSRKDRPGIRGGTCPIPHPTPWDGPRPQPCNGPRPTLCNGPCPQPCNVPHPTPCGGPCPASHLRVVGAAIDGLQLWREPHAHGPPAAAGCCLHVRHVDAVDVRPLLAVDLDAHKALVQQRRRAGVLEALAFHNVAPVAGGVADAQKDGLALRARTLERLGAPRVPVDLSVGMERRVEGGVMVVVVVVVGEQWMGGQGSIRGSGQNTFPRPPKSLTQIDHVYARTLACVHALLCNLYRRMATFICESVSA